jgi:hypothetical protein
VTTGVFPGTDASLSRTLGLPLKSSERVSVSRMNMASPLADPVRLSLLVDLLNHGINGLVILPNPGQRE